MRAREEAARGFGVPASDEPGSGAEPQRNGAHVRAREEAAWGVGAPLATSRGLGQPQRNGAQPH